MAGTRPLRHGLIAAAVVALLGVGVGASYANWSASVTASSTASAAQLAITSTNFTTNAYTFGNETLTTTGSVTVTNTTSTTSTSLPNLTLAFSRVSGSAPLATKVNLTVWYQASGGCTTSTPVGAGAVSGTWDSFPAIDSTLAKTVAATYCLRSTIADRQDVATAGGTLTFVPQVAATLTVGDFSATATATASGQATHYIYPVTTVSSGTWYFIKRNTTSLCVDVASSATTPGGTVLSYTCKVAPADTTNQEWAFVQDGTTGYYDIRPRHATALRLDATGTTSGSATSTQTDSAATSQLWQPQLVSAGVYQFVNKATGFCLTSGASSHTTLTQAVCSGSAAQQHSLTSNGGVTLTGLTCTNTGSGSAQRVSFAWTSASNGGYVVQAQLSGTWHQVAPTTAVTSTGAAVDGTLPSGNPVLNWPLGGLNGPATYNVRILDGAGNTVGTDTLVVHQGGGFPTYRYLSC